MTMTSTKDRRKLTMTIKSLLNTVSLALLIGGASATAQAQIAIGQLADYSGGTSDVGTPYGQGVADAFAWVNKNGGSGGEPGSGGTGHHGFQRAQGGAAVKKRVKPPTQRAAGLGGGR